MQKVSYPIRTALLLLLISATFGCDGDGLSGSSPSISSIQPAQVATGDAIVINGSNLANASVEIQGIASGVNANTASRIETNVPAGASVGVQQVRVTTAEGSTSSTINITQVGAAPTITGISPDPVSLGQDIVITGTGFQNGAGVEIATVLATVNSFTATTINATVPSSGIATGQQASVRVTTTLGTVVSQVQIN